MARWYTKSNRGGTGGRKDRAMGSPYWWKLFWDMMKVTTLISVLIVIALFAVKFGWL